MDIPQRPGDTDTNTDTDRQTDRQTRTLTQTNTQTQTQTPEHTSIHENAMMGMHERLLRQLRQLRHGTCVHAHTPSTASTKNKFYFQAQFKTKKNARKDSIDKDVHAKCPMA